METAASYIDEPSRDELRTLISRNGGGEIFVQGLLSGDNLVTGVQLLAKGGDSSVAAKLDLKNPYRVVIHNHPSGDLRPSPEDLVLSARYVNQEIAFLIIDNGVEQVNPVIPPAAVYLDEPVDLDWIREMFRDGGGLSKHYPGYEFRPSQQQMALEAAAVINRKKHGIVEAPTGTGKSFAYLLPLAAWALKNKKRALVSTHTLNLQQQLIDQDIPMVQKLLDSPVRVALVKGRSHYVCLRKLDEFLRNYQDGLLLTVDDQDIGDFETVAAWAGNTQNGLFSELHALSQGLQEELASDADTCSGFKCSRNSECFFRKARREAAEAHLLIANHAIFFTDMQIRGHDARDAVSSVFPACHRVVLDEAHNLEDVATRFFGLESGTGSILYRLRRLSNGNKGALLQFRAEVERLSDDSGKVLDFVDAELIDRCNGFFEWLSLREGEFIGLYEKIAGVWNSFSLRVTADVRTRIRNDRDAFLLVQGLADKCRGLAERLMKLLEVTLDLKEESRDRIEPRLMFLYRQGERFLGDANLIVSMLGAEDDSTVFWLEKTKGRSGPRLNFNRAPVSVAETLYELFITKYQGVLYTSATMTVSGTFDFFSRRLGLSMLDPEELTVLDLPAMFDYRSRALIAIPQDLPVPTRENMDRYVDSFAEFAVRLIGISAGRIFFLFTSWSLLEQCYLATVAKLPAAWQINCLQQQGGVDRTRLLDEFKAQPRSVLFGVSSFWEGVDVKGEKLIAVVITKLPFEVPNDPLVEARNEQIRQQGGDPFAEMTIPKAVIRLKQGFGRLIRTGSDYGGVFILDTRIIRKQYGKVFFKSLPRAANVTGAMEDCLNRWDRFLDQFEPERNRLDSE